MAGELRDLRGAIRQSERLILLGQLSSGLAHHLRNDVTGARMAIQLHQREGCDSIDPETLEVALRQLELAEAHLRRFLATRAPRELKRARHDLQAIVAEALDLVAPTLRHRQIELRRTISDEPILVDADAEQVRGAVLNLVFNAADAVGPRGWVQVATSVIPSNGNVKQSEAAGNMPPPRASVAVSDSGRAQRPKYKSDCSNRLPAPSPRGWGSGWPSRVGWPKRTAARCNTNVASGQLVSR